MRIKHILLTVVTILSLGVFTYAAIETELAWEKYQDTNHSMHGDEIIDELIVAAGHWAVERGITNSGLNADGPANKTLKEKIMARRTAGNEAFEKALQHLKEFDFHNKEKLVNHAVEAYEATNSARQAADQLLAVPQYRRNQQFVKSWVPTATKAIMMSQELRYAIALDSMMNDPKLSIETSLKHQSWVMSEYAGRERAIIGGILAADTPIDRANLAKLSKFEGHVEEGWTNVKELQTAGKFGEEISKAIAAADAHYFGSFQKLRGIIYQAGDGAAVYPVTAAQWVAQSTAAIDTILAIQEAAFAETKVYLDKKLSGALTSLIINGIVLISAVIIALISAYVVLRKVIGPINGLNLTMQQLADNNLNVDVPSTEAKNEVGDMARTVLVFKDNAKQKVAMEAAQKEKDAQAEADRRQMLNDLAQKFEASVGTLMENVQGAVTSIQSDSKDILDSSNQTSDLSRTIAAAATQASSNSASISSAAEEMSAAIGEIAEQVQKTSAVAKSGAEKATLANQNIQSLQQAAEKIKEIIIVISDIAEQTNLLALNATIEAARAGEAGKGFAVVASEVKNLATETAKATTEISEQIEGIVSQIGGSVESITEMNSIVQQIDEYASVISAASEEQSATTSEITQQIHQLSGGVGEVSESVEKISAQADQNSGLIGQLQNVVEELSQRFSGLVDETKKFTSSIRNG